MKESFKADLVAKGDGYKAAPKAKKGSDNPDKPAKFAKPKVTEGMKRQARYDYFKSKGFKADLIDESDRGYRASKNKFKG